MIYPSSDTMQIKQFSITKQIDFIEPWFAEDLENRLKKLKLAKFDFICIPEFEFSKHKNTVTIESQFCKGNHCDLDVVQIYNDLIDKEWTFEDPTPDNFIVCDLTAQTFAVDLDSFTYLPNIEDRQAIWEQKIGEWPKSVEYYDKNILK